MNCVQMVSLEDYSEQPYCSEQYECSEYCEPCEVEEWGGLADIWVLLTALLLRSTTRALTTTKYCKLD